jgi:hypothetical protein
MDDQRFRPLKLYKDQLPVVKEKEFISTQIIRSVAALFLIIVIYGTMNYEISKARMEVEMLKAEIQVAKDLQTAKSIPAVPQIVEVPALVPTQPEVVKEKKEDKGKTKLNGYLDHHYALPVMPPVSHYPVRN